MELLEPAVTRYHLGQVLTVVLIQESVAHLIKETVSVINILQVAYS